MYLYIQGISTYGCSRLVPSFLRYKVLKITAKIHVFDSFRGITKTEDFLYSPKVHSIAKKLDFLLSFYT